ncbi:ENTH domain-containing protein [Paramyrothecium foliicola]|nr:ENTH domain-containing protein [Paramyrothecium foliicola]
MDLNDLKNTVSNLTLYDLKAGFRKAQNAVMNYTEMEAKVREATNNEPWGASSSTMQEIANGTFNYQTLNEIMPMIYRRFTEKAAEEWRQIYKALQLLEFLIKHGSERVVDDARGHITLLKMLRQFHFIDQNGKDQGINVRNRAKELAELLGDVDRIRSERKKARATKNKYTGVEGGMSFAGGSSGRYGGFGNESSGYGGGAGSSADYGGYSSGVYGDGGGFGGQQSDFSEATGSRSERFEEYDEFDEGDRPAPSARAAAKRPERAGVKKTTPEPPKKKEPEVDLFSFDEPAQTSAPAMAPSNGGAFGAAPANNDDDEFDDFQSATPAGGAPPAVVSSASSTAQFAAPKPVSAPQQADISHMVSMSSISPPPSSTATPAANYSAFGAAPAVASPAQPPKPTGYQPTGPNYFGGIQSQPSNISASGMSSMSGLSSMSSNAASTPSTMGNMKPVTSPGAKPAAPAAGGDAFGALWGKASSNIKKTNTTTSSPALGQLAKEKSSAGIWGAPATASQPATSNAPQRGPSSASDDLRFSDKISSPVSSSATLPFYSKHLPLQTAGGSNRPKLSLITPATLDKMPSAPALGALGMTFQAMRSMQFVSLITIIGLTANFISEMVAADYEPASAIIGTLIVACLATVYIVVTYILYWDSILPFLVATAADSLLLIAVIVVACVVGKPVSYLSCGAFPSKGNTANFIGSLFHNVKNSHDNTFEWIDGDRNSCLQIKIVWGLSIALCVLFSFSAVTTACLWRRLRSPASQAPKDFE